MENSEESKLHIFSEGEAYKLYQGSMLDMLDVIKPDSIDAVVTDPPYELGFMGKSWDSTGIAFQKETWERCFNVLKPGGYLLAFGGSRTFHRIACAIEDAGFEIRDTIMWLYGSGFPKSTNIGLAVDKKNGIESEIIGQHSVVDMRSSGYENNDGNRIMHPIRVAQNEWQGWGTALKPAYEPIIVARKPYEGSGIDNVMKYGVGGININECRVPSKPGELEGRFPANVILTYDETDFEEVCGGMPYTENNTKSHLAKNSDNNVNFNASNIVNVIGYEDSGSAARYFYCSKASKRDRDEGLDAFPDKFYGQSGGAQAAIAKGEAYSKGSGFNTAKIRKNTHPTVKPVSLMQYLVRLVTPKGGTVLDPFNGSGSTGKAVMYENNDRNAEYTYIGIELTPEYLPISDARIQYALQDKTSIQDNFISNDKSVSEDEKKIISKPKRLFDLPDT